MHETVPLGSVTSWIRGINFKPTDVVLPDEEGAVACMRTKNVQSDLDLSDVWGVDSSFVRRPEQFLRLGDVLVSSANSWNLVGKCSWIPQLAWPSTFGGFVGVLRADPLKVDASYLYHWFSSSAIQALLRSFGQKTTSISNLNVDRCLAMDFPLPPIEEQRRIASVLDAVDALRTKRRQALAKLDTLDQAIFIDMFGDPLNAGLGASVPTSPTRLGQLARIRTGKLDANAASESGIYPFFTCAAEPLCIDVAAFDTKAVLVAGNGDLNVKYHEGKFNAYQRTYVIDSLAESVAHPRFLHGFLDIFVGRLRQQAIGGVIKYIKLGMLTEAEVYLPSLEDQHEYVRRVEAANRSRLLATRSTEQSVCLFESLQHRAFRGEL